MSDSRDEPLDLSRDCTLGRRRAELARTKIHNSMAESSWVNNVESRWKNMLMMDCRGLKDRVISSSGECQNNKLRGAWSAELHPPCPPSYPRHLLPVVPPAPQSGPRPPR